MGNNKPVTVSTTWNVEAGSLDALPGIQSADALDSSCSPVCSSSSNTITSTSASNSCEPKLNLSRPPLGCSCIVTLQQELNSQQQQSSYSHLHIVSNAKLCELSVQRPGDVALSYVSTIRAQQLPGTHWHKVLVDLQAVAGWQSLQLKLLTLQGSKDTCSICDLALIPGNCSNGQTSGSSAGQLLSSCQQPKSALSQMDELRLLNQRVQRLAEGNNEVPESLQLLYSKVVQQPAGATAAVKALSAMVAQGMLQQQHSVQSQGQQQDQNQMSQEQHTHERACHVQQQSQQELPSRSDNQAVLLAVQSLETKFSAVTEKLMGAIEQLAQQQQQLLCRLDAVQACIKPDVV